jgi:hypothetical protein
MLLTGTEVFVVLASRGDRATLHCGHVVDSEEDDVIVSFSEPIRPVVGSELTFHYPKNGSFTRTTAVVLAVPDEPSHYIVRFAIRKGSQIVEGRGDVRIAAAHAQAAVEVDGLPGFSLLDVSEGGFAVTSPAELQIGAAIQVGVQHGDQIVSGLALVRSAQPQRDGTYRCGFCVPAGETNLREILVQIGSAASQTCAGPHTAPNQARRCA